MLSLCSYQCTKISDFSGKTKFIFPAPERSHLQHRRSILGRTVAALTKDSLGESPIPAGY